MREKHSVKEIILNLLYSFASYAMPTAALQFIIQPMIASRLGSERNGQYLAMMSFNYLLIGVTATVLNTVRMLQQKDYDEKHVKGDFNIFYLIYTGILLAAMPLGYVFYTGRVDVPDMLLYLLIGNLYLYHDYIFCQYRLKLQYNKILINNILQVVGYGLGLLLFLKTGKWQLVYISAYTISAVYDFFNTDFIREPVKKTLLFRDTTGKLLLYSCSMLFTSLITYCDKLVLYPLLGGDAVSVYNTASIVGKVLILVSAPLNSVLLSYVVKMESIDFKPNKRMIALAACGIAAAYGICVGVGFPLTSFLYPAWASRSHVFIPITVAASLINLIANLFNTVLLRFCKMKFQILINAINFAAYLLLGLLLLRAASLLGFCIGIALAAVVKLIVMIVVFTRKKSSITQGNAAAS